MSTLIQLPYTIDDAGFVYVVKMSYFCEVSLTRIALL